MSVSVVPQGVAELEELLEEEVPCQGIAHPPIARSCGRAATLQAHTGCCTPTKPFKCIPCWQVWYQCHATKLAHRGFIRCGTCKRTFLSVEDFADYRPF